MRLFSKKKKQYRNTPKEGQCRNMILFAVVDPTQVSSNRFVSFHRSPLTAQEVVDSTRDEDGNTDLFIEQYHLLP